MSVTLKPVGQIKARLGIEKYGPVHKYFADRCRYYMNEKYVPEKEGALISTSFRSSECSIVYPAPYAHYQYRGIVYVDPETGSPWGRKGVKKIPTDRKIKDYTKAGSGPYWDKRFVSADLPDVVKEVQEFMKRGSK